MIACVVVIAAALSQGAEKWPETPPPTRKSVTWEHLNKLDPGLKQIGRRSAAAPGRPSSHGAEEALVRRAARARGAAGENRRARARDSGVGGRVRRPDVLLARPRWRRGRHRPPGTSPRRTRRGGDPLAGTLRAGMIKVGFYRFSLDFRREYVYNNTKSVR